MPAATSRMIPRRRQKRAICCSIGDWPTRDRSLSARGGPKKLSTSARTSRIFIVWSCLIALRSRKAHPAHCIGLLSGCGAWIRRFRSVYIGPMRCRSVRHSEILAAPTAAYTNVMDRSSGREQNGRRTRTSIPSGPQMPTSSSPHSRWRSTPPGRMIRSSTSAAMASISGSV